MQVVHFCPALYNYVVNEMKKSAILVLNKVDIVPVELVTAWRAYFKERYPQLHIVCFTSHPRDVTSLSSDPGSGECIGNFHPVQNCMHVYCRNTLHIYPSMRFCFISVKIGIIYCGFLFHFSVAQHSRFCVPHLLVEIVVTSPWRCCQSEKAIKTLLF